MTTHQFDSLIWRVHDYHPDLIKKVVHSIPDFIIQNPESTYADLAMGGGQFLQGILNRCIELGQSREQILPRLYGFERSKVYLNYARWRNNLQGVNLAILDPERDLDSVSMKFDVVIGNPPYQRSREVRNVGTPLWPDFIEKGIDLVKDKGLVSLVVPFTWMQKNARSKAWKLIKQNNLIALDPSVDWAFPGVDTGGITVITLQKQPYGGETQLPDGSTIDILSPTPSNNKEWRSEMFEFLQNCEPLDLNVFTGPINPSINSSHWSPDKTETHIYEVFYSSAKKRCSMWCDQPIGDWGKLKLAVPTYGDIYGKAKITTVGCGRQVEYILGTQEELEKIQQKLFTPESKQLNSLMAYGAYHSPLKHVVGNQT